MSLCGVMLTLIVMVESALLDLVSVETDPKTVSAQGKLSLHTTLKTQIPKDGKMMVTIPSNTAIVQSANLQCKISEPSNFPDVACQSNGRIIIVTIPQALIGFFQIDVFGFTNPPSTTPTSTFTFATQTKAGTTLDFKNTGISLSATAGQLQSATLASRNQVVGQTSHLEVSIKNAHPIPVNSKIRIKFPKWNPQAPANQILAMLENNFSCGGGTNIDSGLTCDFNRNTDELLVSHGITEAKATGTTLEFAVSNFKNPISIAIKTGFVISIEDEQGGQIDVKEASVRVETPATITQGNLDSKGTKEVQERAVLRLAFRTPVPLDPGCVIDITFPSDFQLNGADLTNVQGMNLFGAVRILRGSLNTQSNTYTILDGCQNYKSSGLQGLVDFNSIRNPESVRTTQSVKIVVKDQKQFSICQISAGITYQASAGPVNSISVVPENSIVSTQTTITMQFLPKHKLPLASRIDITFPDDFLIQDRLTNSACKLTNLNVMQVNLKCTLKNRILSISNAFAVDYIPSSTDKIRFNLSGVTMPVSTQTTKALIINTIMIVGGALYTVDRTSQVDVFKATYGILTDTSANPTNKKAYVSSSYEFGLRTSHILFKNGFIRIILPSEVSLPNPTASAASCSNTQGFEATMKCQINGNQIDVIDGMKTQDVAAGTYFNFSIEGIVNPVSTRQSSSFEFYTYTASKFSIDAKKTAITVKMETTSNISTVNIKPSSFINGALNTYQFSFTPSSPVKDGNRFHIKSPSAISPPSTPVCRGKSTNLKTSLTCITLNKDTYVSLMFANGKVPSGERIIFEIDNFKNPPSTKTTATFRFQLLDDIYLINGYNKDETVTTQDPATLVQKSISHESVYALAITTVKITFQNLHTIPIGGLIAITYPDQVELITDRFGCSINMGFQPNCIENQANRKILIKNAFTTTLIGPGATIEITLYGIRNSRFAEKTDSFIIETLTNEQNEDKIDKASSGLFLTNNCNFPCKECNFGQPSSCKACLPGVQTLLQVDKCVEKCDADRVNINNVCEPCESTCGSCEATNRAKCLTCGKVIAPYKSGDKCVLVCPAGTYGDNTQQACLPCTSPCATCVGSATQCKSCLPKQPKGKLYQSQCLETCPVGITYDNGTQCLPCVGCQQCIDAPNICTSCFGNLVLDETDRKCKGACPADTTVLIGRKCMTCNPNCVTCAGTPTYCTKCLDGLVMGLNRSCLTKCVEGEEAPLNGYCQKCDSTCVTCTHTPTTCPSCKAGYLFYNFTCVTSCPQGFSPDLEKKEKCILDGLRCPYGYEVKPTGDGCTISNVSCIKGYTLNSKRTSCIPAPYSSVLIYFPFLGITLVFLLIALIGWCKSRSELIISCFMMLLSSIEGLAMIVQIAMTPRIQAYGIMTGTLIAFLFLIGSNVFFFIVYHRQIKKDNSFKHWLNKYSKSSCIANTLGLMVNFKMYRWFYCKFFGLSYFHAPLAKPETFFRPFVFISAFNTIFSHLTLIVTDIVAFFFIEWGYQLLICCIETLIISLILIVLTIIEFIKLKKKIVRDDEENYLAVNAKLYDNAFSGVPQTRSAPLTTKDEVTSGDQTTNKTFMTMNRTAYDDDTEYEDTKQRRVALENILTKLSNKQQFTDEESSEDYESEHLDEDAIDRKWMRRCESFSDLREFDENFATDKRQLMLEKCVTVPVSPRSLAALEHPLFSQNKEVVRIQMQQEFRFNNVYAEQMVDKDKLKRDLERVKARKTQTMVSDFPGQGIDEGGSGEKEEEEAQLEQGFTNGLMQGVLDNLSDDDVGGGALARRIKRQREQIPEKRRKNIPDFEIKDIIGDLDIDGQGNFIVLKNDFGALVDKGGRPVNVKGYMLDRRGNVVKSDGTVIFTKNELTDDGEIPPPYSFEKHKKHLLNPDMPGTLNPDLDGNDERDDEELIEKELEYLKKQTKASDESSIESNMGDTPSKYNALNTKVQDLRTLQKGQSMSITNQFTTGVTNDDNLINISTQNASPAKRITAHDRKMAKAYGGSPKAAKKRKTKSTKKKSITKKKFEHDRSAEQLFPELAEHRRTLRSGFLPKPYLEDAQNQTAKNLDLIHDAFKNIRNEQQPEITDSPAKMFQEQILDPRDQMQVDSRPQFGTINKRRKSKPRKNIKKVYGNIDPFLFKGSPKRGPMPQSSFGFDESTLGGMVDGDGEFSTLDQMQQQVDSVHRVPKSKKNTFMQQNDPKMQGLEAIYTQQITKETRNRKLGHSHRSGKALKPQDHSVQNLNSMINTGSEEEFGAARMFSGTQSQAMVVSNTVNSSLAGKVGGLRNKTPIDGRRSTSPFDKPQKNVKNGGWI